VTSLPYNYRDEGPSSGWSGSDTSKDRAQREDEDGTTTYRQGEVIRLLGTRRSLGLTWKELSDQMDWHHGQSSGVLSVLHKDGRIARLSETRNRCKIYVLHEFVNDRSAESPGVRRSISAKKISDLPVHECTCGDEKRDMVAVSDLLDLLRGTA
jgi:hypothetical protein